MKNDLLNTSICYTRVIRTGWNAWYLSIMNIWII